MAVGLGSLALGVLLACGAPMQGNAKLEVEELGLVRWERDHEQAFLKAKQGNKPVLLLFQEIPGWSTCKDFGRGPLSHPLLVDAMQDLFVPLAIYNNKDGQDKLILERYDEPAWNNPVVRFFGADRRELMPRKDRVWSAHEHADRMLLALEKAGKQVPAYLRIAQEELSPAKLERATFSMACYWKGEAFFGGLEGVRSTSAGWLEGDEVVDVLYDPLRIDLSKLVGQARSNSCANRVWVAHASQLADARRAAGDGVKLQAGAPRDAKTSDRKFHLRRSALNQLDLTPLQATRANSILERGGSVAEILSKEQLLTLEGIKLALSENREALDGLERPDTLSELPAYRQKLRQRLKEHGIKAPISAR